MSSGRTGRSRNVRITVWAGLSGRSATVAGVPLTPASAEGPRGYRT